MIELESISKSFKVTGRKKGSRFRKEITYVKALEDISFQIPQGEIVGYIGPNGAGKSTTIKIMSGILVPDGGKCTIDGKTPWKDRVSHVKQIGVVFGQRTQLWWDVPVIDSFLLLKDIYKISDESYQATLEELTRLLNLETLLERPVRQLSLGQRMRCEIAAALIHSPKILFLDEPTIGLDAASKIAVRDFIKTINQQRKVTVILTTHDMNDIEALANRIILIGKGKKLYDGDLNALKAKYITHKVVTVDHEPVTSCLEIEGTSGRLVHHERTIFEVDIQKTSIPKVLKVISEALEIRDVTVDSPPIETIILKMYEAYAI